MRKPGLVFMAVSLILINACGKVPSMKGNDAGSLSENQAMEILSGVPMDSIRSVRGVKTKVSAADLTALIQKLAAEGKIKLPPGAHFAVGTGLDLSQLTNIFNVLQNGGVGSVFGLAQGLIKMNAGNTAGTGSALDNLLAILNQLAPIIAMIAPQFAPIIAALTTIVPMVIMFINLFKKPSAALSLGLIEPVKV